MKKRHWIVTLCFIIMIVYAAIAALLVIFNKEAIMDSLPRRTPDSYLGVFFLLSVAQLVATGAMWMWKKWGFWAAIVTTVCGMAFNLSVGVNDSWQIILGLTGPILLYGILQIKKEGVSGWENLE